MRNLVVAILVSVLCACTSAGPKSDTTIASLAAAGPVAIGDSRIEIEPMINAGTDVAFPGGFESSAAKLTRVSTATDNNGVRSAIFVGTTTDAATLSYEWNQLNVLNNYANMGENVAFYSQAFKNALGATWAGVFEAHDRTHVANPAKALYGLEIDLSANGTDAGHTRFGMQIVGFRDDPKGAVNVIGNGLWIGPAALDPLGVLFDTAINVAASGSIGLSLNGNYAQTAISVASNGGTILDMTGALNTKAILRLASGNPVFNSKPQGNYIGKVRIEIDGNPFYISVTD